MISQSKLEQTYDELDVLRLHQLRQPTTVTLSSRTSGMENLWMDDFFSHLLRILTFPVAQCLQPEKG